MLLMWFAVGGNFVCGIFLCRVVKVKLGKCFT